MTEAIRRDALDLQEGIQTGLDQEGSPRPSSKRQNPSTKLLGLAGIAAVLCALCFAKIGQTQDGKPDGDILARKAIVHFATLIYRESGTSKDIRVPASNLERLQLVRPDQGNDYWIELFYRGGDYVFQRIDKVVFLRRDSTAQQMKLPVNLVAPRTMGFPFVN